MSIPAPEFTGTILSGLRSDHGTRSSTAVLIREGDSTLFDGVVRSRGRWKTEETISSVSVRLRIGLSPILIT